MVALHRYLALRGVVFPAILVMFVSSCLWVNVGYAQSVPASCGDLARRGALPEAADCWKVILERAERDRDREAHRDASLRLAEIYQALGHDRKAIAQLDRALTLARAAKSEHPMHLATILASLGHAHIVSGPRDTAEAYLREALDLVRAHDRPGLMAVVQNDLGNVMASRGAYHEALVAYRASARQAETAGDAMGAARALVNAAKVALPLQQFAVSAEALVRAWQRGQGEAPSHAANMIWLSIGDTAYQLCRHLPEARADLSSMAYHTLNQVLAAARQLDDGRSVTYALGYLGRLYEAEQRSQEALRLTRQAIVAAQRAHVPEALYQWQLQAGRLLTGLGDINAAIASYTQAVETLQAIRSELPRRYGRPETLFRSSVGQVYLDLVDLLLARAASISDRDPRHAADLQRARGND